MASDPPRDCGVMWSTSQPMSELLPCEWRYIGKSRLLVEVAEIVKKAGKQAIVLQPNRRLADSAEVESNSIYGHLYTGSVNGGDEPENEAEQKKLKVIPLRACEDESDCVYLLDDAHLLSNSRFSTPDGKQYGTGQLLSDFFDFAALGKGARKVVFFGDPYQIQRGGSEGAVLSGVRNCPQLPATGRNFLLGIPATCR